MITDADKLTIRQIALDCIQVKEYQPRYPDRLTMYMHLMQNNPGDYCGLLSVTPSPTHAGMYVLLDGHHRFCASVMTGRPTVLCVVIEARDPICKSSMDEVQ